MVRPYIDPVMVASLLEKRESIIKEREELSVRFSSSYQAREKKQTKQNIKEREGRKGTEMGVTFIFASIHLVHGRCPLHALWSRLQMQHALP